MAEEKYEIGSCCVTDDDPTLKCVECGWEGENVNNAPGLGKEIRKVRTEYFVRFDDDGRCLAFYRKRYEKESLFEEVWNRKYKTWKHIPARIIWMQISGECSLTEVSSERFKELLPEAFETRQNTL